MTITSPLQRRLVALAFFAASLLVALGAGIVAAHADLVSATPANGSTVSWSPGMSIVLTFSEALRSGSKADITGPGNSPTGTATIDATDATRLTFTPTTPLAPGSYTVAWTSIAQDRDVQRGIVKFTVQAAATAVPSPSAVPSAVPSAAPSAVATAAPSPSPSPAPVAATGAEVLVPVLAALLAISGLGLVLLRSRRSSARR